MPSPQRRAKVKKRTDRRCLNKECTQTKVPKDSSGEEKDRQKMPEQGKKRTDRRCLSEECPQTTAPTEEEGRRGHTMPEQGVPPNQGQKRELNRRRAQTEGVRTMERKDEK